MLSGARVPQPVARRSDSRFATHAYAEEQTPVPPSTKVILTSPEFLVQKAFQLKRMSRFPRRWPIILLALCVLGTFVLNAYYDTSAFAVMPFAGAIALALFYARGIRCPQCRQRLLRRTIDLPQDTFRHIYDCPHCQISWDPQFTTWHSRGE
jgi:hypothetical protein